MMFWSPILFWWPGHIGRNNRPEKIFFLNFGGQKSDFFDFLKNWTILCRMVNIGFLRTFRGPKGRFPAKYHISGHYMEYLRILKNRIFCDFLRFLRNFSIWLAAGIGRNQSYRPEIIKNVILKLFRCLFIYKSCLYDI